MINNIKNSVQSSIIYKKINLNDINSRAAAMSYYLLLSIFPFLIFMINLIGYIPIIHINRFIVSYEGLLPQTAYITIHSIIESAVKDKSISMTILSFGFTLWSSSRAVRVFIKGANKSYNIRESRSFFNLIMLSFYFTIELILLIISTMVFLVYGEKIGYFIFNLIGLSHIFIPIWNIIRYSFGISAIIWILSTLYSYAPNIKVPFKEVLPGTILSIVGWLF
ncbi:MAG: YihY/virulence factor BrkB family protein, partial [Paraclostridium sp.]